MVIHDEFVGKKNKRVIVATRDELLHNLHRALAIHIDGTFKSTPKGWMQTLIITAEISPKNWSK